MAQSDPILDLRGKLIDFAKKAKEWGESGSKKQDTSWHDEMVRKANESFRKEAGKKKAVKKPAQSEAIRKKTVANKAYPKKKVAGKR
jgi:CTP synthase (UTP-ammonia lyase)